MRTYNLTKEDFQRVLSLISDRIAAEMIKAAPDQSVISDASAFYQHLRNEYGHAQEDAAITDYKPGDRVKVSPSSASAGNITISIEAAKALEAAGWEGTVIDIEVGRPFPYKVEFGSDNHVEFFHKTELSPIEHGAVAGETTDEIARRLNA